MKAGIYRTPNGNLIYVAKDRTIKATSLSPSSWPGTKVSHRSKDDTVLIEGTGYRCTRFADVPNGCIDHAKALQDASDANAAEIKEALGLPADLKPGESISEWAHRKAEVAKTLKPGEMLVDIGSTTERVEINTSDLYERAAARAVRETSKALRHAGAAEATRRFVAVPSALSAPYGEAETAAWRKKFTASLLDQGFRLCHKASARKHRKQGHTVLPIGDGRFAWRAVTDDLYPYQRKTLAQLERYLNVPVGIGKAGAL